jgi:hypothetical protein
MGYSKVKNPQHITALGVSAFIRYLGSGTAAATYTVVRMPFFHQPKLISVTASDVTPARLTAMSAPDV